MTTLTSPLGARHGHPPKSTKPLWSPDLIICTNKRTKYCQLAYPKNFHGFLCDAIPPRASVSGVLLDHRLLSSEREGCKMAI